MLTPAPDPAPHTGSRPVTYVAYIYDVPAENPNTGRLIPGWWYHCRVPVRGKTMCSLHIKLPTMGSSGPSAH